MLQNKIFRPTIYLLPIILYSCGMDTVSCLMAGYCSNKQTATSTSVEVINETDYDLSVTLWIDEQYDEDNCSPYDERESRIVPPGGREHFYLTIYCSGNTSSGFSYTLENEDFSEVDVLKLM